MVYENNRCSVQSQTGVIVGGGVDLSVWTEADYSAAGLNSILISKVSKYIGIKENVLTFLLANPLVLTQAEATEITTSMTTYSYQRLTTQYTQSSRVEFSSLQYGVRTAIFSVFYQYGSTYTRIENY